MRNEYLMVAISVALLVAAVVFMDGVSTGAGWVMVTLAVLSTLVTLGTLARKGQ